MTYILLSYSYFYRHELAKEVVELLMGAADCAKSLIDANDRLILFIEVARLFGTLGYQRKAAFFSRQVAQLYLQQDNTCASISAMKVLSMTAKAYHIESKGSSYKSSACSNVSLVVYHIKKDYDMHLTWHHFILFLSCFYSAGY